MGTIMPGSAIADGGLLSDTKDSITNAATNTKIKKRLASIDTLRGLVMIIMLVDHIRETFFLGYQVTDPMQATTDPVLFFTRMASMICAPIFIALTGLSAWLYGQNRSKSEVSAFLIKRGLLLMLLEVTVVGFAWSGKIIPTTFWLQVIWSIGICMIALSVLIYLPRKIQIALALVIIFGHNLLDGIRLQEGEPLFAAWAMLHQRDIIHLPFGMVAKTTYPVLPWIGVILLGYLAGPLFAKGSDPKNRTKTLYIIGAAMLVGFFVLRLLNIYGDKPWVFGAGVTQTILGFLALTKYPPSLLFLLFTLGIGCILLAAFENADGKPILHQLSVLGGAPMFFYLLHLLVLKAIYEICFALFGANQGDYFGVANVGDVWLIWFVMIVPLYIPTKWYSGFKKRHKDISILSYF